MREVLIADDHPLFRDAMKRAVGQALPDAAIFDADGVPGLLALVEAHPEADVVNLRFTDLWKWVQALPEFADEPQKSNEKILEAIQAAWLEERD